MTDIKQQLDEWMSEGYTEDGRNANKRLQVIRRAHARVLNKEPENSALDQRLPAIAEWDFDGEDWTASAYIDTRGNGVIEFRRGSFFLSKAGAFDAAPVVDKRIYAGTKGSPAEQMMRADMHAMGLRWR